MRIHIVWLSCDVSNFFTLLNFPVLDSCLGFGLVCFFKSNVILRGCAKSSLS